MLSKHCEKIKIKRVKEENRGGEGESSFAALADGEASWILKTTIELLSLFFLCVCVLWWRSSIDFPFCRDQVTKKSNHFFDFFLGIPIDNFFSWWCICVCACFSDINVFFFFLQTKGKDVEIRGFQGKDRPTPKKRKRK